MLCVGVHRQLATSCTTMGAPNTFFTKKVTLSELSLPGPDGASLTASQAAAQGYIKSEDGGAWVTPNEGANVVLIVVVAVVALLLAGFVAVLVKNEKQGRPIFNPLVPATAVPATGSKGTGV